MIVADSAPFFCFKYIFYEQLLVNTQIIISVTARQEVAAAGHFNRQVPLGRSHSSSEVGSTGPSEEKTTRHRAQGTPRPTQVIWEKPHRLRDPLSPRGISCVAKNKVEQKSNIYMEPYMFHECLSRFGVAPVY